MGGRRGGGGVRRLRQGRSVEVFSGIRQSPGRGCVSVSLRCVEMICVLLWSRVVEGGAVAVGTRGRRASVCQVFLDWER